MPTSARLLLSAALLLAGTTAFAQAPNPPQGQDRITIDVLVSDKLNHPVSGLQQQDFTVLDNTQPQKLLSFRALSPSTASDPVHVILLVDMINANFQTVAREREDLGQYLNQDDGRLAHDTSIAVMTESGLRAMQGSSTDGHLLLSEFKKLRTELRTEGRATGFYGAVDRMSASLTQLEQLAGYESGRPGRKLVLVISPGWAMFTRAGIEEDTQQRNSVFNAIVRITNALRKAHMALYTLDPFDLGRTDPFLYEGYLKGVTKADHAEYPYLSLQVLSIHSGGRVLISGHDTKGEVNDALRDAGTYYELTFAAPPAEHPNEYHALQVKVNQPNVTVHTTTGYYAAPQVAGGLPKPQKP